MQWARLTFSFLSKQNLLSHRRLGVVNVSLEKLKSLQIGRNKIYRRHYRVKQADRWTEEHRKVRRCIPNFTLVKIYKHFGDLEASFSAL